MTTINKTDISLLYYLALSTQQNPVSSTSDSLDMEKNLASESMAHVDQMTKTGGQDGAAQQARNADSDGRNMMTVSPYWFVLMECIA